jgi:replicative DNA helicase
MHHVVANKGPKMRSDHKRKVVIDYLRSVAAAKAENSGADPAWSIEHMIIDVIKELEDTVIKLEQKRSSEAATESREGWY